MEACAWCVAIGMRDVHGHAHDATGPCRPGSKAAWLPPSCVAGCRFRAGP